jgi:hypothetical protein
VVARLTEPDAAALSAGQAMHLVLTDIGPAEGDRVVSWAFAPDADDAR